LYFLRGEKKEEIMGSNIAMEARQRADNYRRALQFLEGLQNFTYADYTKSIKMAGIEMTESEMRQQWNMSEMTIPGTESLRQTQIEVLKEGVRVFGDIAQKLGGL
jgi:lipoate synthase